ncbi:MAG: hypothetical protein HC855_15200 [Rhizobiales bacterium]|nr:hypothetical protein [Hyphomicrobiales bacterium]
MMQAKLSPEEIEKLATEAPEGETPETEAEAVRETKAPAPSWFAQTENRYVPDRPNELAERYRRTPLPIEAFEQGDEAFESHYRRMTGYETPSQKTREWRPPASGKMAPIPPRPTMSRRHIAAQDAYYGNRRRAHEPIEREGGVLAGLSLGKSFLLASCFAVITGAAAGFGITRIGDLPSGQEVAAMLGGGGFLQTAAPDPEQQHAAKSAIEVSQPVPAGPAQKPISIATLNVEDAAGTLNSSIPLLLHAESGSESEPISLKIMGLPETAYLTAGTRVEAMHGCSRPGRKRA